MNSELYPLVVLAGMAFGFLTGLLVAEVRQQEIISSTQIDFCQVSCRQQGTGLYAIDVNGVCECVGGVHIKPAQKVEKEQ